jgi:hypothetical protein
MGWTWRAQAEGRWKSTRDEREAGWEVGLQRVVRRKGQRLVSFEASGKHVKGKRKNEGRWRTDGSVGDVLRVLSVLLLTVVRRHRLLLLRVHPLLCHRVKSQRRETTGVDDDIGWGRSALEEVVVVASVVVIHEKGGRRRWS